MNDVIIIGGGPAGSTAASYLTMAGRQVLLFEKENFPRPHVGESLLPFCYPIFEELGVLEAMKSSFVRKPGVRFIDKDGSLSTTWCFDHVIHDESYLSFQVVRSSFDNLLLNNARRLGVTALEETRVTAVDLERPNGLVAVKATGPDGDTQHHQARFIIDCSGRHAFLASTKGGRKKFPDLDRTALWTHFDNVKLDGGLEDGLSLIIYLGGKKKGWMWVFPLGENQVTAGVVLNNSYIRTQRTALEKANVDDWKQALYEKELGFSPFVGRLLTNATQARPLTVEGDYSYYTDTKYGRNFALVGDAATFIDPIFSSGIYLAMNSAKLVAGGVDKWLAAGEGHMNGQSDPLSAVYQRIDGAYKLIHKLIQFFYTANVINFAQMGSATDLVYRQHEDAMATGHFMLAGDFFDRYDHYSKIIDTLQNPRFFELYKQKIIQQPGFQVKHCNNPSEPVFPSGEMKAI